MRNVLRRSAGVIVVVAAVVLLPAVGARVFAPVTFDAHYAGPATTLADRELANWRHDLSEPTTAPTPESPPRRCSNDSRAPRHPLRRG